MNVRRWSCIGLLIALGIVLIAAPADAQRQGDQRQGGQRQGGQRQGERTYDPASLETIQATVVEVVMEGRRGGGSGVHLVLQTEGEPTVVHLGPRFYLDEKDIAFAAGDTVTVVGSKTVVDGEPALLAREISTGDDKLVLRDDAGRPAWRASDSRATERGGRPGVRGAGRRHRGGRGAGPWRR